MSDPSRRTGISLLTATAIVVSNMVGTGIFTSLGFQVGALPSGFTIVVLWALGGLCAFCGAVSYGELAAALPRSGGEYHYLSKIFHPSVGFVSGWLSATVGFAAPIALAAMALGKYFSEVWPGASPLAVSIIFSVAVTLVHLTGINVASRFQNTATWLKVMLILVFIVAGMLMKGGQPVTFLPVAGDGKLISSAPFAISLIYVMYAYAGWNATTYIVGEVANPGRTVPLSVAIGTLLVSGLYIGLNMVFMHVAPISELANKLEVGHVAATHIFGAEGGKIMSGLICLGLISSISAMTWVGPRVTMVMGEDFRLLAPLAVKSRRGVPAVALMVQLAIVILLLCFALFEQVLKYVQFSITLCSFLAVLGVIVLRFTQPNLPRPYRTWGYPVTPLIFLGLSAWMLYFTVKGSPWESLAGLGTILLGLIIYFVSPKSTRS
ncbi:MAG: amino acid permease-associated protein [Verrucomicrobiaceae bacterium]|nr:amino acid permease-associated protein [Verrucomicrobiaceae bacterium]